MLRLGQTGAGLSRDVALAQLAVEEFEGQTLAFERQFRVVAVSFVAEEGVLPVELVPGEVHARVGQGFVDLAPAFPRHVGVLPAPDHQEFTPNVLRAGKGVVAGLAQGTFVKVGGVEADGGAHVGILRGGAEAQVSADADAERAQASGAGGVGLEEVEHGAGITVEGVEFLLQFQRVAAVGPALIVGEHAAGRLELVPYLRHGHDVAVPRQQGRRAADRPGDLEDFRIEQDARVAPLRLRAEDMGAHRAGGRGEFDGFVIANGHDRASVRRRLGGASSSRTQPHKKLPL